MLHVAFVSQGLEIHSSMSEKFNKNVVKVIRLYLRGFLSNRDYKEIKTSLSISYCIPVKPEGQSNFDLLKIISYQVTCTGSSITSKSSLALAII